ncbi:hypothetical protein ACIF83_39945 [Streptomyces sp. NPDC085866]
MLRGLARVRASADWIENAVTVARSTWTSSFRSC